MTLSIPMQVGEGDRVFGSIGSKDIVEALEKKGHTVDRKKVVLPDAIKTLGDHNVTIKLGQDVTATVKVSVVKAG